MSTYTLIDDTNARTHLSREQVAEVKQGDVDIMRAWLAGEQAA